MKLFEKIGLSTSETNHLIRIVIFSSICSIILVAALWTFQKIQTKSKSNKEIPFLNDETKITPLDINAHTEIAKRYIQSIDYEHAIPHLERAVALQKNDIQTRCLLAYAFMESGEYEKAVNEYEFVSQKKIPDSLSGKICAQKAICQFYLGEKTLSIQSLKECTEHFPNNAEAFCFLGQIEATRELPSPTAITLLNKAIAIDSNYVEAWYQLARYYMELKQYSKSRELLLRAIDIDPLHEKSQSRIGMTYYYLQNYDLAKKSYQTALALNPSDFNTRYNLGEVYYSEGDTARAIKEYKRTLDYNPEHVEANFKLGLLLMANNMIKEAIIHLERASQKNPDNIRILIQLAVAYEKLGDKEKARSIYQTILEIDALNSIAQQKIKLLTE